jgi:leucyl aminopeptidase
MLYNLTQTRAAQKNTDCLILGIYENSGLPEATQQVDEAAAGFIRRLIQTGNITGKFGQTWLLHAVPNIFAKRILLLGCGPQRPLQTQQFINLLQQACAQLQTMQVTEIATYLTELEVKERDLSWKIRQQVERIEYSQYRFNHFKQQAISQAAFKVDIQGSDQLKSALEQGHAIAMGVKLARELGNMPPNICTPAYLAEQAIEMSRSYPAVKTQILETAEMEELGMGALLAVAKGSRNPAKFIVLDYRGIAEDAQPIVLVGKGVTFDTGGICIKPKENMDEMKFDMCGAASIMGAIQAAARLQLPLNIIGLIPAAENMPDGQAYRPGDIVKSLSGQTIEILNTDAEGRLLLCDALSYAQRFNPKYVVDVATLTGAIIIALGFHTTGLFSNDPALAKELINASHTSSDPAWQLPYDEQYAEVLASNFADMANSAGRDAGSITAACFLAKFTQAYAWAHLDIAGTASKGGKEKGATGRPVPLLVQFLLNQIRNP